jgi:hypothetical protein
VRKDVVEREEPRTRGKRRPWAAIPTVRLAELGVEALGGEVIELGVVTRGDHRRVVPGHQLVREAHHGLAAADAGEGRELSAQEVTAVERCHRQKAGLARRVPERLNGSHPVLGSHSERISTMMSRSSSAALMRPASPAGA